MRKMKQLLLAPALLGATLLPGCQTWGPTWSELTGQRYNVTIMNRRPASINMVDNQGAFVDPNLVRVEPGKHRIVLQAVAPGWPGGPDLEVMNLDVEPCKRYYLNAQYTNLINPNFTAVVDDVEEIAGCKVTVASK